MYCILCAGPFHAFLSSSTDAEPSWIGQVVGIPIYPKVTAIMPLRLMNPNSELNWSIAEEALLSYNQVTPVTLDEKNITFTTQRTDLRKDIHIKPIQHIYGIICHRQCYRVVKRMISVQKNNHHNNNNSNNNQKSRTLDQIFKSFWLWKERDEKLNLLHNLSYSINMKQHLSFQRKQIYPSLNEFDPVTLQNPLDKKTENGKRIRTFLRVFLKLRSPKEMNVSSLDYIMSAARLNNIEELKKHITIKPSCLNEYDELGFTPLHWAVDYKHWIMVKWIMKQPQWKIKHKRLLKSLLEQNQNTKNNPVIESLMEQMMTEPLSEDLN